MKAKLFLISLCTLAATIAAAGADAEASTSATYVLDHIALGSNIKDVIGSKGQPDLHSSFTYQWSNATGGITTVLVDSTGAIVLIDVLAGKNEKRSIDAPGGGGILGESGHINVVTPADATPGDWCGAGLIGSPCWAYVMPGGVELVTNFGKDNGLADWALTELILARRDVLLSSGRVIAQP